MGYFRYTDPEVRTYNAFGELQQGDVVNHEGLPDHRFTEMTEAEVAEYLASTPEKE